MSTHLVQDLGLLQLEAAVEVWFAALGKGRACVNALRILKLGSIQHDAVSLCRLVPTRCLDVKDSTPDIKEYAMLCVSASCFDKAK